MLSWKRSGGLLLAMAVLFLVGGANDVDEFVKKWMAEMDAKSPEDQYPNWQATRALMMRKPPKVGDEAPDFTLKTRDGSESVRLSQFEGKTPVVLIFGSWT